MEGVGSASIFCSGDVSVVVREYISVRIVGILPRGGSTHARCLCEPIGAVAIDVIVKLDFGVGQACAFQAAFQRLDIANAIVANDFVPNAVTCGYVDDVSGLQDQISYACVGHCKAVNLYLGVLGQPGRASSSKAVLSLISIAIKRGFCKWPPLPV